MTSCPAFHASRTAGFTLVEAAIVMVVIGLILGVVLQGQALIRNAEYRSLKSDISDYQSAYYAFRERYGALPGDFADASDRLESGMPDGDGNGVIADGPTCDNAGDESCMAWQHLRAARLIGGNPELAGPEARPSHPYGGVFSSFFTGDDGNGVFENKMLITGIPGHIARRLDADVDDERHDRGRVSCEAGCSGDGYPGAEGSVRIVFSL